MISAPPSVVLVFWVAAVAMGPAAGIDFLTRAELPTVAAAKTTLLYKFTFPTNNNGLNDLNPFLVKSRDTPLMPSGAACATRASDDACWEYMSPFSGLTLSPLAKRNGPQLRLIGITDRGPNQDCSDGRTFMVPRFAPAILEIKLNQETGLVQPKFSSLCYLKSKDGSSITGLPNRVVGDDKPYPYNQCSGTLSVLPEYPTGYDPNGLDTEDVQVIPGTIWCVGVEEYSPSLFVFNCNLRNNNTCGRIAMRYVPSNVNIGTPRYPVQRNLPSIFSYRRGNRGFESVALSPNGKTAITLLQSPIGPTSSGSATALSHISYAVMLDMSNPIAATVKGVYVYVGSAIPSTWVSETKVSSMKLSGAAWAAQWLPCPNATCTSYQRQRAENRPIIVVNERATDQVKYFLADFTSATNILPMLNESDPYKFDRGFMSGYAAGLANLTLLGVTPVKTAILMNTGAITPNKGLATATIPFWDGSEKQEGVAILNACVLASADDNDFGIASGPSQVNIVQLGKCIPQVYAEMTA